MNNPTTTYSFNSIVYMGLLGILRSCHNHRTFTADSGQLIAVECFCSDTQHLVRNIVIHAMYPNSSVHFHLGLDPDQFCLAVANNWEDALKDDFPIMQE